MKKLAEVRLKEKLDRKKKMKRIGGGFTVPFEVGEEEVEELRKQTKIQNWVEEEEKE
jgi:hypothetical protein